jgi:hypothetical protein
MYHSLLIKGAIALGGNSHCAPAPPRSTFLLFSLPVVVVVAVVIFVVLVPME